MYHSSAVAPSLIFEACPIYAARYRNQRAITQPIDVRFYWCLDSFAFFAYDYYYT